MSSFEESIEIFKDMGFSEESVRAAIKDCGSTDIATVIDHLEKAVSVTVEDNKSEKPNNQDVASTDQISDSSDSKDLVKNPLTEECQEDKVEDLLVLRCEECNSLFSKSKASRHAELSGHCNFAQATDSEKLERIRMIRKKMEDHRKNEGIEKEKKRRLEGRKMGTLRAEMKQLELKKIAEERAKEKKLEIIHRQRVKDQIKADRMRMKLRHPDLNSSSVTGEKQLNNNSSCSPSLLSTEDCKIMVRLGDGRCLANTFKRKQALSAVRLWIELNHPDGPTNSAQLVQGYPRKIYTEEEMQMSLEQLNIGSSHVLMLR
ncbi:hypothetical protein GJ496_008361 [Pomphorhynchus laevis]|nr:hypothetical protein GJ496_008361 [Pomphorhynchus laevis]